MLSNVARVLSAGERAREPRTLGVIAYYDGWACGSGQGKRATYPRRLTPAEAQRWRDGFDDGRHERVCHAWHGFRECQGDHPPTLPPVEDK